MRPILLAVMAAVASVASMASPVGAQHEYRTLEHRVAGSDLVVAGQVTSVDAEANIGGAPGMGGVAITVKQVFKGETEAKELMMLWQPATAKPAGVAEEMPPSDGSDEEAPADGVEAPAETVEAPAAEEAPALTFDVGQSRIWFFKRHAGGQNLVVDTSPVQIEPAESGATVAAVVIGLKAPEKVLAEGKESPRSLLAAAYGLTERVVPESLLPIKDGRPDTTGARLIDAAIITAAGKAAAEFFGRGGANDRLAAEAVLTRLGCPTATLAPPLSPPKGRRTNEEAARDLAEYRAAWDRRISTWVNTSLPTLRFYEPAKGVAVETADTQPRIAPPKVTPTVPAPAAVPGKGIAMKVGVWADLFAEAEWNKFPDQDLREYRGTLIAAKVSQRKNLYRLKMADTTWDVYTAGDDSLQPYVGREVTIRGKYVLLILETRTSREIWPTAMRLEK